jgi:hypothetical protein
MNILPPAHMSSTLPPLYAAWMDQILTGPIPEETEATCEHCAMCTKGDARLTGATHYFNPQTKCCTYMPRLPNFLVGRILHDPDPDFLSGRMSVEARIHRKVAVTPLGLIRDPVHVLLYRQGKEATFGQSRALRCPHYLEESGHCGVWRHRESTCATWFCKYVRGAVGLRFWQAVLQLLRAVEESLAQWCVDELDVGTEALQLLFPSPRQRDANPSLDAHQVDGTVDPKRYQAIWGKWADREQEFFTKSAALVNPLVWNDVRAICGPEIQILVRLTQEAYRRLVADDIPPLVQVLPFRTIHMGPDSSEVYSYSKFDPLQLPKTLTDVLHSFDGRPTDEVLQAIATEQGITIGKGVIRKLVDFELLGVGDGAPERKT